MASLFHTEGEPFTNIRLSYEEFNRCREEVGDEHTSHVSEQWFGYKSSLKGTFTDILSSFSTVSIKQISWAGVVSNAFVFARTTSS